MTRFAACHDVIKLVRGERFEFHQRICHRVQLVDVFRQQVLCRAIAIVDNLSDFLINCVGRFW